MTKLFGTDGIRGLVNQELNSLLAMKIGGSVAHILKQELQKEKLTFLLGTDTRISKDMLKSAIVSGFLSEGCDIIDLGVIPTPAIAYLIEFYHVDGGFVISASHNKTEYNGIKVFNAEGLKLTDEIEEKIEDFLINNFEINSTINQVGKVFYYDGISDYVDFLLKTIPTRKIPFKVCIDTSNGSATESAKLLFSKLDIDYTIIHQNPDGYNINLECGSTNLTSLREKVIREKFDLGIAYDGDADRCLFIDDEGVEVDGDYILAICSKYMKIPSIVGTVMANLGLMKYCEKEKINFIETQVGDRYVLESMLENGYLLGGEQSGHIIFRKFLKTGDGELTSLQLLSIMAKTGKKLSKLKRIMQKYPQVLKNLEVSQSLKNKILDREDVKNKIFEIENRLGSRGRVLVRKSGTENLIRVMLEGEMEEEINNYSEELIVFLKNIVESN